MSFSTILTERDGAAFVITLNRPERRNAFSKQCMAEVAEACRQAEADAAVSAVVITGGMQYFSAGADLTEAQAIKSPADGVEYMKHWERLNDAIESLGKPVIAAIEGFCMTGGFEFVLACDIRIASANASFALTSSKIGTVPGAGGTQRLPRLVGIGRALDILFSAESFSAEHAERIGLVEYLTPAGGALAKAKELAALYATRAPLSLSWAKRAVLAGMQMDQRSAIEFERFLVTAIYGSEDRREGIGAFLEKRKAVFKGR